VGAYFILFGPERVWIDQFTVPTFLQILQLSPGFIATAGGALTFLGSFLTSFRIPSQSPVEFLLAGHTLLPQGHEKVS
jgi:hypothetical protein